jgi:hypothetical protein
VHKFGLQGVPGGLEIDGYPAAEKAIKLDGFEAERLAHLLLHMRDLEFAGECLVQIRSEPLLPSVVREALWRAAIVHYMKCFGSGARFSLDHQKFLEDGLPRQVHDFFRDLRRKHVVHDENPYLQSVPMAVISPLGQTPKVQDIVVMTVASETLTEGHLGNLDLLIGRALHWVREEFDRLRQRVHRMTDELDHAELLQCEQAAFRVPTAADVERRRS